MHPASLVRLGTLLVLGALGSDSGVRAQVPGYTADQRITQLGRGNSRWPAFAIDRTGVTHAVWSGWTTGSYLRILYARMDAEGVPLAAPVVLNSAFPEVAESPDIAVDERGDLHVVWSQRLVAHEPEIHYLKLSPGGDVLIPPTRLTVSPTTRPCDHPRVACDGAGSVHVAWLDSRPTSGSASRELVYERRDLQGNVLLDDTRLTYSLWLDREPIALAADPAGIDVTWREWMGDHYAFFYGRFDLQGVPLVRLLLADNTDAGWGSLARDRNGDLHLAFSVLHVRYARLAPNGTFVVPPVQVDASPGLAGTPTVAPLANGALVIWVDRRPGWSVTALAGAVLRVDGSRVAEHLVSDLVGESQYPVAHTDAAGQVRLLWMSQCDVCGFDLHLHGKRTTGPVLGTTDPPRLGTAMTFHLLDALRPAQHFIFALAFGTDPGIPLGDGRTFPLTADWLLLTSFDPAMAPLLGLVGNHGSLDHLGAATVTWNTPGLAALAGTDVYAAFATFDPRFSPPPGVLSSSTALPMTLRL